MVDDMSSDSGADIQARKLLQQLREGSEFLESQSDRLVDIWSGLQVVSYYETVPTRTVKKVSPNTFFYYLFLASEALETVSSLGSVRSKTKGGQRLRGVMPNIITDKGQNETGEHKRNGELFEMVKRVSGQLNLPNEHRIPVPYTHTDMVKFLASSDPIYRSVATHIKSYIESFLDQRRVHFGTLDFRSLIEFWCRKRATGPKPWATEAVARTNKLPRGCWFVIG
jgi:hypothetical protein